MSKLILIILVAIVAASCAPNVCATYSSYTYNQKLKAK